MSIPDCDKDRCANTQIHKYNDKDRCAIEMAACDADAIWRSHFSAEAEMPLIQKNTYVQIHKYTHVLYTGVLKVQMRMVGAGR